MCGIVGIASVFPNDSKNWIRLSCETMFHRGPDDAGEWWSVDSRVGFGHRRLSIIDLTAQGHQPMHCPVRNMTITYNGEIYNYLSLREDLSSKGHSFRSNTDTEVLLAAYTEWGIDCLNRIRGMFAFAIYDEKLGRVFLARDRAGEKPLFYRLDNQSLCFASELKALMANPVLPRVIDSQSLDCYLLMGYVPGSRCMLQGYNKLPPAHAMTYDLTNGSATVWRYWDLPELAPSAETSTEESLLEELECLLEQVVGDQLTADVPVGVLLSGGVDSSLVTAMAVRKTKNVRTFSIGFPGGGKFDETVHARLVAKHFGTEHIELMATPSSADLIPALVQQFDEPMVDSSMLPTWLVSNLVGQHCKVALGGDGGDELFGGYNSYRNLLWMQQHLNWVPHWLKEQVSFLAQSALSEGWKGKNYLDCLNVDLFTGVPLVAKHFGLAARKRLMKDHSNYKFIAESIWAQRTPSDIDLLRRLTRMDFQNYLAEDILVKVDRASMLNSLEIRAPLLDVRVIEFAFGKVPSSLKIQGRKKKVLLQDLAKKLLPKEFDSQRKQGFSIPLGEWLKAGPFRDLFWDTLLSSDCLFDLGTVKDLLRQQDFGRNNGERLFALVQFELWRKTYAVRFQ